MSQNDLIQCCMHLEESDKHVSFKSFGGFRVLFLWKKIKRNKKNKQTNKKTVNVLKLRGSLIPVKLANRHFRFLWILKYPTINFHFSSLYFL